MHLAFEIVLFLVTLVAVPAVLFYAIAAQRRRR